MSKHNEIILGFPYIDIFTLVCRSFPNYQMGIYYQLSTTFSDVKYLKNTLTHHKHAIT